MSKTVLIPECNKDIGGIKEEISMSPNEKKDGMIGLLGRFLRFDSLKKPIPESPTATESSTIYYGVYIPCEIIKGPDEKSLHVYENKLEALDLVRRYKSSRFKAFRNYQDALTFALRGAEPIETHDGNGNSLVGEKPYPFKAPSPQDMVALRKAIEAGLTTTVQDRVWDNPRYLVSSGNTPAIVQEGARYNALHIAAKAMNAEICNLLLNTVGNPVFVQALYGMDTNLESCKEFASILVDRYLNTPDKGLNETPLHFAVKFGAEHVVDVLTSFPQCNKNAKNKHGELPKDIIRARAPTMPSEVSTRIAAMLRERYYVPVLHSDDDSAAPTIGRPFTPAEPPELNRDPLSPRYEIRAFAGPMPALDADSFRRRWKTPPRAPKTPTPTTTPTNASSSFRLRELCKGLETVGRNLAAEMNVGWKEYWPFLDTFTDLRSQEGLVLLENYLKAKYETAYSFAQNDSLNQAEELNFSRISLSNLSQSPYQELSPMSELCVAMKTCKITDKSHWRKTDPIRQRLCRQPTAKPLIPNGDTNIVQTNHTVNQLLCIERTCQVFAKRLADALIFSLSTEPEVAGESLKSEAKHLQHTIYTYMDDERFKDINFSLIHSRLAQLVVFKLKQQTKELDDINNLVEFLIKLRCPNDDIFSSDDERKPFTYRTNRMRINHVIDGHVRCLSSFICEELTESDDTKGPAVSEVECREIWEKAGKCRCDWKVEVFERNSKKNASFRKNRSMLSTSPKSENFIRRLTFEHDIGDGKCQASIEKPVSQNSPAGDGAPAAYSVDVAKCIVVEAEISEDESAGSGNEESYQTASEHSDSDDGEMHDASDRALTEPFIYGEEPSKMDRLVYDAVSTCQITPDTFPNLYRWRHTVALYTDSERQGWQPTSADDTTASWPDVARVTRVLPSSTPRRDLRDRSDCRDGPDASLTRGDRVVPLQVSNWLRVTGPNSPKTAAAAKNVGHNVSFGF